MRKLFPLYLDTKQKKSLEKKAKKNGLTMNGYIRMKLLDLEESKELILKKPKLFDKLKK